MKVLHVAPSIERSYGGPTRSLAGYVAAAQEAGIEAHVAAPHATPADVRRLDDAGARSVVMFDSSGKGGLARSPSLVKWVDQNAASYDVIHVHGLFNFVSSLSSKTAAASSAALVIRPFGTLSRYTFTHRRGLLKRGWFNVLEKRNLMRASGIHFTTATERDQAGWHNLPLAAKAHVVPPPYLDANMPGNPSSNAGRDAVLFVGRIHPVKNLEALLDAWPSVLRANPLLRLVIAGSGDPAYERTLQQRTSANGIGGSVSFAGFLSEQERDLALSRSVVFVLPSHHENFGMAALEAVAAGVPVVFSPQVQLGDFVSANRLGVVVDASPAPLARAINEVLSDHELRERVATSGRAIVNESYSSATIGQKLRTMYLAVLEVHRKSPPEAAKRQ